ncbi:MAG TPA: nitrate ABC transporter substrate-binding protein [Candidatus Dorea gallistercoris]|uniref:Nitrate ABC transporter substrate-binding protein n=1 Tax=Candidatus Dorea gallistercoris TaxID=2838542 RepID=A0A9D1UE59_9FIRM|nr:nitrate ABC transporter substrate-binding protein [Candidatus Dorea gallistercoris]
MVEAQTHLETATVIAYMIIAAVIGFLIDTILVLFEKALLRWRA